MSVFSVPVTIGVDEERIAKEIENNVEKQVIDKITAEVKKIMFKKTYWDTRDEEPLRRLISDEISKILQDKEDLIVKLAAEKLADKLSRQKAVKEKAAAVAEEVYK